MDTELETKMETVEEPKKLGLVARIRNHRGFSLVEMAIVLVIIGIIIAAIVKGQDLIINANAKKVISAASTWRNLSLAYLDRNGRYPGDSGKNGVIGDGGATEETTASALTEITTTMSHAPANPVVVGSYTYYMYFGNVPGLPITGTNRNVIVMCKDKDCTASYSKEDLELFKAIDTALDGEADAGKGSFRSSNKAVTATPDTTKSVLSPLFNNYSSTNVAYTWANTDVRATVWAFDRPF